MTQNNVVEHCCLVQELLPVLVSLHVYGLSDSRRHAAGDIRLREREVWYRCLMKQGTKTCVCAVLVKLWNYQEVGVWSRRGFLFFLPYCTVLWDYFVYMLCDVVLNTWTTSLPQPHFFLLFVRVLYLLKNNFLKKNF